ncbi:unnamed protein product [Closterium sp. Naga37s-1]|nr:unnamed protein product [Closterium sp. Naga37s-1]
MRRPHVISRLARQPLPHQGFTAALLGGAIRQAVCGRAMGDAAEQMGVARWDCCSASASATPRPSRHPAESGTPTPLCSSRLAPSYTTPSPPAAKSCCCRHPLRSPSLAHPLREQRRRVWHGESAVVREGARSGESVMEDASDARVGRGMAWSEERDEWAMSGSEGEGDAMRRMGQLALADVTRLLLDGDEGDAREGEAGDMGGGNSAGGAVEGGEGRKEGGQWTVEEGEARDGGGKARDGGGEARDGGGGSCRLGEQGKQGEQAEWAGGSTAWPAAATAPSDSKGVAGGNDPAALGAVSREAASNVCADSFSPSTAPATPAASSAPTAADPDLAAAATSATALAVAADAARGDNQATAEATVAGTGRRGAAVEGMAAEGGADDWLHLLHDDAHWDLLPAFSLPPLSLPPLHLPACPSMHAAPPHPTVHNRMVADLSQIGSSGDLLDAAGDAPVLPASPALGGTLCCSPDGAACGSGVWHTLGARLGSGLPSDGSGSLHPPSILSFAIVLFPNLVDIPAAIPLAAICTLFCGHCSALLALPSTGLPTITRTRCSRALTPPHGAGVHVAAAAAGGGARGAHRGALSSGAPPGALAPLAGGRTVHACGGEAVAAPVDSVDRTWRDGSPTPTAGDSARLARTPRRVLPAVLRRAVALVGSGKRGQVAAAGEMGLQEGMHHETPPLSVLCRLPSSRSHRPLVQSPLQPLPPRLHLPAAPRCATGLLHPSLPLTTAHLTVAADSPEAAPGSDGGVGGAGSAADSKRAQRALRKRKRAATLTGTPAHYSCSCLFLPSARSSSSCSLSLAACPARVPIHRMACAPSHGMAGSKAVAREGSEEVADGSREEESCKGGEQRGGKAISKAAGREGGAPVKRHRKASTYNLFIRDEMMRLRAGNPDMDHREAFKEAARRWGSAAENVRGSHALAAAAKARALLLYPMHAPPMHAPPTPCSLLPPTAAAATAASLPGAQVGAAVVGGGVVGQQRVRVEGQGGCERGEAHVGSAGLVAGVRGGGREGRWVVRGEEETGRAGVGEVAAAAERVVGVWWGAGCGVDRGARSDGWEEGGHVDGLGCVPLEMGRGRNGGGLSNMVGERHMQVGGWHMEQREEQAGGMVHGLAGEAAAAYPLEQHVWEVERSEQQQAPQVLHSDAYRRLAAGISSKLMSSALPTNT